MSRIKYIVGVDCALRNVGVTVFDNTGKNLEAFNIATTNGMNDHDSIDRIVEQFFDRLRPYLEKVDGKSVTIIYFELIYFGQKGKGTARAEATGVLKWNLREDGHRLWGVVPNSVNSFLSDKFNFKYSSRKTKEIKATTMRVLHRHCGFWTTNDNIADAYAIGLYGYAHTLEKQKLSPTPLSRAPFL